MDFVGAIKAGFKNYAVFKGTATRPEYWYWVLFTFLVSLVANALDATGTVAGAFAVVTFLPGLAVSVRRLRDAGFSWLWLLLPAPALIPFILGAVQLVTVLMRLGFDLRTDPNSLDDATLQALMTNEAIVSSGLLMLGSLIYLFFTSLVVNIIFPAQVSKSFEKGNKRVAPSSPESPVL